MEYYRIMPGAKSIFATECLEGGFIGGDWAVPDLTDRLPEDRREFNEWFIPTYRAQVPDKSKMSAAVAGGMLYTIAKGMKVGDVVLSPDQQGNFHFGKVSSEYMYVADSPLPHQRKVDWMQTTVHRSDFSEALQNSMGSIGTVSKVTKHAQEVESAISGSNTPEPDTEDVEDFAAFALEKHLEDFLVRNWEATELGKTHAVYEEDGERIGQQFDTDTGPIDILAVSHDKSELLVIELKRGRASDAVVGQIQRYMGYVKDELLEADQTVRGVIIALEDDKRIRRALSVTTGIEFYRYEINFNLKKIEVSGST